MCHSHWNKGTAKERLGFFVEEEDTKRKKLGIFKENGKNKKVSVERKRRRPELVEA